MPRISTGFDKAIEEALSRGENDLARRIKAELRMCRAMVNAALAGGNTVSVCDGEEWVVVNSRDRAAIYAALFSTDEDRIVVRDKAGQRLGWFHLVYGNDGFDVVSDYSDNPYCNGIWATALRPLADRIEVRS